MRIDNKVVVEEMAQSLKSSSSVFITDFQGLSVSEVEDLREKLDEQQCKHHVLKNALFKFILNEAGLEYDEQFDGVLKGSSSFTFGGSDVAAVAKVIVDFSKDKDNFSVKGGILDGKFLAESDIKALAALPSREELIAKVVGGIAAPLTSFVSVMAANLRNLVNVVGAIKDKKENEN